jgi:hypothetical protein
MFMREKEFTVRAASQPFRQRAATPVKGQYFLIVAIAGWGFGS